MTGHPSVSCLSGHAFTWVATREGKKMDKFDVLFIAMGVVVSVYLVAGIALEIRIARRLRSK